MFRYVAKLPENCRFASTLTAFKSRLKTFLFATAFSLNQCQGFELHCPICAHFTVSELVIMLCLLMSPYLFLLSVNVVFNAPVKHFELPCV